jgi:hypothetical protein
MRLGRKRGGRVCSEETLEVRLLLHFAVDETGLA